MDNNNDAHNQIGLVQEVYKPAPGLYINQRQKEVRRQVHVWPLVIILVKKS